MIGSRLLGQQPTFNGADFAMPEISLFGYYQFRDAVATPDSWDKHDGVEIVFVRSGEACWEFDEDNLAVVSGGQAVLFPAGRRHRIANGVYTPCRFLWLVFHGRELAGQRARLFPQRDIEALFDVASGLDAPIILRERTRHVVMDLCRTLTDERLFIGSAPMMAEVRAKIYAAVIGVWQSCTGEEGASGQSELVRRAAQLLRADAERVDADDRDERIEEVARQLGYGRSRLYDLFTREMGMSPNDFRQRIRIKRCCERLAESDESITSIGISCGFHSSQYFSRVFKKYVGVTPSAYRRLFGAARPSRTGSVRTARPGPADA
jgi:AraC-like DNA-binding protein